MAPSSSSIFAFGNNTNLPGGTKSQWGEKAYALAVMAAKDIPVPPGFILSTAFFENPANLDKKESGRNGLGDKEKTLLRKAIEELSLNAGGAVFGDKTNPLLICLREGTDREGFETVTNLGLTEKRVKALAGIYKDERQAWDAYRRFLYSYGVGVLGVDAEGLENLLTEAVDAQNAEGDHELDGKTMETLAKAYREYVESQSGEPVGEDPELHLFRTIEKACALEMVRGRALNSSGSSSISGEGTPLIVQHMEPGTGVKNSGAGSLFTRHPASGEKKPYGKFLFSANRYDLTAGLRFTEDISKLEKKHPQAYQTLMELADKIEGLFHDAQEIQFILKDGELFVLRARSAGRTPEASLKIAFALVDEGIATPREALPGVDPAMIDKLLHPMLDKNNAPEPMTKGLPASPGSAVGQVVFFAEHAEEQAAKGIRTILVRHETTPEDIGGLSVAEGIVTATGGLTSHAAVVARGMGKCCVVGASSIEINYHVSEMSVGNTVVKRGDWVSLDGNTGEIFVGQVPQIQPTVEGDLARVMEWSDANRTMKVRTNADTAEDAERSLEMGAEGIGLCRTEHMFFDIERIPIFRRMILSMDTVGRSAALSDLLPMQRKDFMDIFRVMTGKPVTIRLLDPPLHEFLPRGIRSQTRMARTMNIPVETIQKRIDALMESNPMLGHRGCRLAITYPEIYQMQVRAITEAACIVTKEGIEVLPEIMVPLVSTEKELSQLRKEIEAVTVKVQDEMGESFPIPVGTMVETPRAALCSASIARHADFFSFGTNDLTQMTYGFSRDDAGTFLPEYLEKNVIPVDPFVALDTEGVGELVRMATVNGRATKPDLKVGICGEHGGEASSVKFCHSLGLDYVSCSPFRLPIARLAAAQAAIVAEQAALETVQTAPEAEEG